MLTDIGWFFFDLLLLGYVEDHRNGISFCISNDSELEIYIEVGNSQKVMYVRMSKQYHPYSLFS